MIYELIVALVSFWLLVNSIKKENSKEKMSDYFFDYYIIILPLFGFKLGYGVKDRSDFILTEIKRCHNSNDRGKFILFLIRRENDLNK